jgi:hypothetical protein
MPGYSKNNRAMAAVAWTFLGHIARNISQKVVAQNHFVSRAKRCHANGFEPRINEKYPHTIPAKGLSAFCHSTNAFWPIVIG